MNADGVAAPLRTSDTSSGRRVALAGIVFAVLIFVAFSMLSVVPTVSSSDADFVEFYRGGNSWPLMAAAFYVVPFAGIAFIWFLAALRRQSLRLGGTEGDHFSTVQLVSGVLFIAMIFAAAATGVATAAAKELGDARLDVASSRQLTAVSQTFLTVFAVRSAAVFVLAGSAHARSIGMFPRWFTALSFLVGLVLLVATTFYRPVVLLFPLWVAIASVLILRRPTPRAPTAS